MTGPEHYIEAERLLAGCGFASEDGAGYSVDPSVTPSWLAAAQVHATLALAAATAIPQAGEMVVADHDEWVAAASAYKADLR